MRHKLVDFPQDVIDISAHLLFNRDLSYEGAEIYSVRLHQEGDSLESLLTDLRYNQIFNVKYLSDADYLVVGRDDFKDIPHDMQRGKKLFDQHLYKKKARKESVTFLGATFYTTTAFALLTIVGAGVSIPNMDHLKSIPHDVYLTWFQSLVFWAFATIGSGVVAGCYFLVSLFDRNLYCSEKVFKNPSFTLRLVYCFLTPYVIITLLSPFRMWKVILWILNVHH